MPDPMKALVSGRANDPDGQRRYHTASSRSVERPPRDSLANRRSGPVSRSVVCPAGTGGRAPRLRGPTPGRPRDRPGRGSRWLRGERFVR